MLILILKLIQAGIQKARFMPNKYNQQKMWREANKGNELNWQLLSVPAMQCMHKTDDCLLSGVLQVLSEIVLEKLQICMVKSMHLKCADSQLPIHRVGFVIDMRHVSKELTVVKKSLFLIGVGGLSYTFSHHVCWSIVRSQSDHATTNTL